MTTILFLVDSWSFALFAFLHFFTFCLLEVLARNELHWCAAYVDFDYVSVRNLLYVCAFSVSFEPWRFAVLSVAVSAKGCSM